MVWPQDKKKTIIFVRPVNKLAFWGLVLYEPDNVHNAALSIDNGTLQAFPLAKERKIFIAV